MTDLAYPESMSVIDNIQRIIETPVAFSKVDYIINKSYLPLLHDYSVVDLDETGLFDAVESTCFFPIKRIVFDKEENNIQKLSSVYSSLSNISATIIMMVRGYENGETELFLGIGDQKSTRINGAYPKAKSFLDSFVGNFTGCRVDENRILNSEDTRVAIHSAFCSDFNSVASVSCIGSLRGEKKTGKNSEYYQGMEKVIEAMNGKEYTILIMAQPVSPNDVQALRSELEELYTSLSVFSKMSLSVSKSEAENVSESISKSLSNGLSITKSKSLSIGDTTSISDSTGTFESTSNSVGIGIGGKDSLISGSYSNGKSTGSNAGHTDTTGHQTNTTGGTSIGKSDNFTNTSTAGSSKTETNGKTVQLTIENKRILEALNSITQQLQRLKNGGGVGLFATSAYFLSDSVSNVRTASSLYKAVVSGDSTSLEYNGINVWHNEQYKKILKYLRHFLHPVFQLKDGVAPNNTTATSATLVTSAELAIQMSLPQHSIDGVPVKESVPFGRNVVNLSNNRKKNDSICIGNIYHLGTTLPQRANLDIDSLTMHTFVTGTTGSGKSNTIYGLINNLCKARQDIHFLIIEPAKGEYKNIFGNRDDVSVYGTNPYLTKLLRINPFKFQQGVHVLEHIDRLVGLFNVCWPMEAAMPAVLKQSIEEAYITAGWDLRTSTNEVSPNLFPCFIDVMNEVNKFIENSDYSDENKGNYKGALCTRLRELTTGLNGMIFVSNEIENSELFDSNVVVDISRVGSSETKSLLMGLLVIRMQEYRQSARTAPNSKLRHLTVLEEAHNLLKRTSTEQSMDSANIVGKSVEMISNSLAEMRTYGEGFIIADQSPEQMDLSVIRNTNTKIIMRLPSYEDRKLVGKSASLNDAQIDELSKLPTGIAAVFQNDWMESVLVNIPYYESPTTLYQNRPDTEVIVSEDSDKKALLYTLMRNKPGMDEYIANLNPDAVDRIGVMNLATAVKRQLIEYAYSDDDSRIDKIQEIMFEFFNSREVMALVTKDKTLNEWRNNVEHLLDPSILDFKNEDRTRLLICLCHQFALRDSSFNPVLIELTRYWERRGDNVK